MVFFRVSQDINVKATDGTLINYFKLKEPSVMENETIYITTYDDYNDLKEIFSKVDKEKYFPRVLNENRVRTLENFPIELGILNISEYDNRENLNKTTFQNIEKVDIYKQLRKSAKNEI